MSNPKISVIIPVYNVEKYLSECLDSVINQTLKDIEIICVNDGSTDNSLSILREYSNKDSRIQIIDKENEGLGYTRKAGLTIAKGDYILFLDSDDKYDSNHSLEKLYNNIIKSDSDILIFDIFNYLNGNSDRWNLKIDKLENVGKILNFQDFSIYILNGCFSACNKLYRKKFLDNYTDWFFPKKIYYEDMPFHVQIMIRAEKISYTNNVAYLYRVNPLSITKLSSLNTDKKRVESLLFVIEKIYNILIENKILCKLEKEFICFFVRYMFILFNDISVNVNNFILIINKFKDIINKFPNVNINDLYYDENNNLHLVKEQFIFCKIMRSLTNEKLLLYMIKKKIYKITKHYKICKNEMNRKNSQIQNLSAKNKDLRNQNSIKDQVINRLQNSLSYKIGRFITYPFSIFFEICKYIRDYNLIKKSDLFDSEYYLSNNEDVKKAKMDPIKHYLKLGWKEGRNPSAKFNSSEYLHKRPDVRMADICPLVHYLRFGRNE